MAFGKEVLYEHKLRNTAQRALLGFQSETLVHLFLECPVFEPFWKDVIIRCWNIKRSDNINPREPFTATNPESKRFYALNQYLLIPKYHIFLAGSVSTGKTKPNVKRQVAMPLKTQTAENTKLSGPLPVFAMRKVFFLFYLLCTCILPTYFPCSNDES